MTNQNLEKARLWAETWSDTTVPANTRAAIDTIQSLPDQWIDAEKVREEAGRMRKGAVNAMKPGHNEFSRGYAEAMRECARHLRNILTPSLPTLADMTAEEREACQWMQADVKLSTGNDSVRCVIADPRTVGARARVWTSHGGSDDVEAERVIPLPGEPKLKWPGGEPIEKHGNASLDPQENIDASFKYIKKTTPEQAVAKDVCNSEPNSSETPKSSINPEDVPADELWLVEFDGNEWVGKRNRGDEDTFTWRVASLGIKGSGMAEDSAITLIHKLVPETHALPEGMRLADHGEHGRIVVSQRADEDGDYAFFESIPGGIAGASWGYVNESELTFLGGEA